MMHTHPFLADGSSQIQFDLTFPRARTYRVWVATLTGAGSTMTLSSPKLLLSSSAGDQGAPAWTRR